MADTEPELGIFSRQTSLPVVGLGHYPSHKTFELQPILPARFSGEMVAQSLWEWPTNDL